MIDKELKKETEKWLKRIEEKMKNIQLIDKSKQEILVNIEAYISDCRHFLEKNDLIRAFEAIIYAWGIIETLERIELVKYQNKPHQ